MICLFQSIVEKVVYKVCEENSNWTVAKRSAWIDSQVFGFSRAIQAFGLDRFKKNCTLMYNGFNYVLAHLFPHTAQYMNPSLSQMGFAHLVKEMHQYKEISIERKSFYFTVFILGRRISWKDKFSRRFPTFVTR